MQPPDGDPFYLTGEVCRGSNRRACLASTFVCEEPNPDDVETRVGLSFLDLGESTEVEIDPGSVQDRGAPRASPRWVE